MDPFWIAFLCVIHVWCVVGTALFAEKWTGLWTMAWTDMYSAGTMLLTYACCFFVAWPLWWPYIIRQRNRVKQGLKPKPPLFQEEW